MASQPNSITRNECQMTHNTLMEKIDSISDKIEALAIKMAELPGTLIEKMDDKYAAKSTEADVAQIKKWFWSLAAVGAFIIFIVEILSNGGLNSLLGRLIK